MRKAAATVHARERAEIAMADAIAIAMNVAIVAVIVNAVGVVIAKIAENATKIVGETVANHSASSKHRGSAMPRNPRRPCRQTLHRISRRNCLPLAVLTFKETMARGAAVDAAVDGAVAIARKAPA